MIPMWNWGYYDSLSHNNSSLQSLTKFGRNQISAHCSSNLKTTIHIVQDPTLASRWTRLAHLTTTSRCGSKISLNCTDHTWRRIWLHGTISFPLEFNQFLIQDCMISFLIYATKYVEYDEFYLFPRKWYSLVDIDNKQEVC